MTSTSVRNLLALGLLIGLGAVPACSKGGDKKKDATGGDDGSTTTSSTTSDTGTSTGDCLRLDGEDTATDSAATSGTDTGTGTSTDDDAAVGDEPSVGGSGDCGSSGSSTDTDSSTEADGGGDGGTPAGGGSGWNAGPGLEGCEAQGKAWRAVVNKGPGQCGEDLVKSFCCTETEIANQLKNYPSLVTELQSKFNGDKIKGAGLKLYHCSQSGNKYTFHWGVMKDKTMYYHTVYAEDVTLAGGADTSSCPHVTSADLGITATTDGGGTTLPTDLPAYIEGVGTSEAGLAAFLGGSSYDSWAHDDPVFSGTQHGGGLRTYFNAKLDASLKAGGTAEHPVGSIAVLRMYQADQTTLKGYGALLKYKTGAGKDGWLFYAVPDLAAPTTKTLAVGPADACATCHATTGQSRDFIRHQAPFP
jgi:hypothetical protein